MLLRCVRERYLRQGEALMARRGGSGAGPAAHTDAQLRGKCCELALYLHHGQKPAELLAEVEELASRKWAFREGDDT